MSNEHELDRAETIDAGFIIDDEGVVYPGKIARFSNGRLCVVKHERTTNDGSAGMFHRRQEGTLWLFSGENSQYVLFGVRGDAVGAALHRADYLGGYEKFVRHRFDVDAVFRVLHPVQLLGAKPSHILPYPSIDMGFDALWVKFDEAGLWVGLDQPASHGYPPPRPRRVKHPEHKSRIGELSITWEAGGDLLGVDWHHRDAVELLRSKPASLDAMYDIGRTIHDFINLTFGCLVPAKLVLYTTGGHEDRSKWRGYELVSQTPHFSERERPTQWPMLTLVESGGLPALARLIRWCNKADLNRTILHRVVHQQDGWELAFAAHWRTLTMLHGGDGELQRFSKLVKDVGLDVAQAIIPAGVAPDDWYYAIKDYRNKVIVHPQELGSYDARVMDEGPAFTHHMEFLLKAYVLKRGLGIRLRRRGRVVERLKYHITEWNKWDWRDKLESHTIY